MTVLRYLLTAVTMLALAYPERLPACSDADAAFPKIMQALGSDSTSSAETLLRAVPAAQQDCPSWNLALGRIEASKGRVRPALRSFAAYVEAVPNDPVGRVDLAQTQVLAGDVEEAQRNATAAIELANNAPLLLAAAQVLQAAGSEVEAERALKKAVSLAPQDERTHFQLGMFYDSRQQHEKAEQSFRQVIARNANNAQAWDYLGLSLMPQGKAAAAEQAFVKGLAVNRAPHFDAFLPYNYAQLLAKLNRLEEALEQLNEAAELVPGTRAIHYERAKVQFRLGSNAAARKDAEAALSYPDPNSVVAESQIYYLLVRVCRELGDDAAVTSYAKLARSSPAPRSTRGR